MRETVSCCEKSKLLAHTSTGCDSSLSAASAARRVIPSYPHFLTTFTLVRDRNRNICTQHMFSLVSTMVVLFEPIKLIYYFNQIKGLQILSLKYQIKQKLYFSMLISL